MDEHFFENVFTPFFIQSASINIKIMKKLELSDKQKRFCKAIKHILPIFNKLNDDETITISNVMDDNQDHNNNSDSDNSNNISSSSESSEEELDEEGDKLVDTLTYTSIQKYKTIKSKKWVITSYNDLPQKDDQSLGLPDDNSASNAVSIVSSDDEKDNAQETNDEVDQSNDKDDNNYELIDIDADPCNATTDESSDEEGYEGAHSSDDLYDKYEHLQQYDYNSSKFNPYNDSTQHWPHSSGMVASGDSPQYYPGSAYSYMS